MSPSNKVVFSSLMIQKTRNKTKKKSTNRNERIKKNVVWRTLTKLTKETLGKNIYVLQKLHLNKLDDSDLAKNILRYLTFAF